MAINKKLIHFNNFSTFNSKKLSANTENNKYTIGIGGTTYTGNPEILYQSICYIKDTKQMWTHGQIYDCLNYYQTPLYTSGLGISSGLGVDALYVPIATTTSLGVIKTGFTTNGTARNYKVQTDNNGNAYVNVPWESGSYSLPLASSSTRGGIKIGYSSSTKTHLPVLLSSEKAYVNVSADSITTAIGYTPMNASAEVALNIPTSDAQAIQVSVGGQTSNAFTVPYAESASTATKLAAKKTIALTGGVTGSVETDFSGNVSITTAVTNDSHTHSNYVPTTRKVNNKALSSDITLAASDVGAVPTSGDSTINGVLTATGFSGPLSGNADSATKDGNGNNIADTYAPKVSLMDKQDTLISGTNIKTINNQSILGTGDLRVTGVVEYFDLGPASLSPGGTVNLSIDQIQTLAKVMDGTTVILRDPDQLETDWAQVLSCVPTYMGSSVYNWTIIIIGRPIPQYDQASDIKIYTIEVTTTASLSSLYATPRVGYVYSLSGQSGYPVVSRGSATSATLSLVPNVLYMWDTVTKLTISFDPSSSDSTRVNEYFFQFTSGSTATTLSVPSSVKWANGVALVPQANTTYQVSIINNLAVYTAFK